jgi:RNA polymerase sigma factor (sigma-70 family)
MEDSQGFSLLLGQAQAGSDQAARDLVDRFGPFILRVIRNRLDERLRNVFDSADFSQAVWASFFALPTQKYHFQEPGDLIRFLEQVARNKVVDQVRRRLGTKAHPIRREIPLENSQNAIAPMATASQEAIAREQWRIALAKQPHHQEVLSCFRAGFSQKEIAERIGISERTVRRALRRLKLGLER